MMASIKADAANLLLDRGIRFNIPDAPIWDRLRGRGKIWIKPLRGGTIVRFSIVMLENGLDKPHSNVELNAKLEAVSQVVAIAIINDIDKIENEYQKLSQELLGRYPARFLIKIYRHIESLNKFEGFMNITNYFLRQTTMMLERRTGQMEKGS